MAPSEGVRLISREHLPVTWIRFNVDEAV